VVVLVRVKDGSLKVGEKVKFFATEKEYEILKMTWVDIIRDTLEKNKLDIFNPDNLHEKVKSFINFYVKRVIFNMLSANRIILKEKLVDPRIQYNKIYESLSRTDCSNKIDIPLYDIVYYEKDYKIFCYSLTNLLIEKEIQKIDLQQKYEFSKEFLDYLDHFQYKEEKEEEKEEKDIDLDKFLDDLKKMEISILRKENTKEREEYVDLFFKQKNRDELTFLMHGEFVISPKNTPSPLYPPPKK
jgi:hypothetical protein